MIMEPTSLYNLNKIQKLSLSMCMIKNGACFTIFIYSCMLIYTWLFIYVVYMYIYIYMRIKLFTRKMHLPLYHNDHHSIPWEMVSFLDPF